MKHTAPTEGEEAAKELPPEVRLQAETELGETPQVIGESLARLRQLIKEEPLFRCPTDRRFLVKFLRGRKYSVEAAMQTIRSYFRVRRDNPDIFEGLLPSRAYFEAVLGDDRLVTVLDDRDPQGRCIFILRPGAWNSDVCPLTDFIRTALLIGEHVLADPQTQVAGVVTVLDTKGLRLHHMRHYTPLFVKRMVHIAQDCYPVRLKGIYIVNNPPLLELLYAAARPFLKTKIVRRIHLIGDDYDKLHAFIPRDLLPSDYGGTHEPYDCGSLEKELRRSSRYFEELDQGGYRTE